MKDLGIKRAAVIGLGITGVALAEILDDVGVEVRASDAADNADVRAAAERLAVRGIEVKTGGHEIGVLDWADLVAPAKAVPPTNEVIEAATERKIPVWSDFEIAYRLGATDVLAVTGTNGKTTTTELLFHAMQHSGFKAVKGGNLPNPLVAVLGDSPEEMTFVCEASSQGLTYIDTFRPRVAVLLNVAEDHFDFHGTRDTYVAIKSSITKNQRTDDLLAFNVADETCAEIARKSPASLAPFALGAPASNLGRIEDLGRKARWVGGIQDDEVIVLEGNEERLRVGVADIRLKGPHNLENVLGAAIAALFRGAEATDVARSLSTFEGLPHRMSLVREIDGVRYVDDSKATNPHATMKALEGLERVVLIAGGQAKGLELGPLASQASKLEGLVVMGESAELLMEIFRPTGVRIVEASDVEEAAGVASRMAGPGATVLLSPACASYDQYTGYSERGERFAKEVLRW